MCFVRGHTASGEHRGHEAWPKTGRKACGLSRGQAGVVGNTPLVRALGTSVRKTKYVPGQHRPHGYFEFAYATGETRIWGDPNHLSRWELSCGGSRKALRVMRVSGAGRES